MLCLESEEPLLWVWGDWVALRQTGIYVHPEQILNINLSHCLWISVITLFQTEC